ncbi:hypothetical protein Phpb_00353 [Photorhabdus namnaonensis]|uniref:Uncharacterized protein n=1 Tax=Photorhabdus namnaonensis TaxID=1851568 RepID=A0A1B8YNE3_9GAMM|nr:hypothetical protein Phpb_00353 [Photorhabdus namnaonensis]
MNNKSLPFILPEIVHSEIVEVIDSLKTEVDNYPT